VQIDPQAWNAGVKDAYADRPSREAADHSYAAGRVEGEALRLKHQQEYEQLLFSGRQTRPMPPAGPSHG
jgi:hypothetical protein